MLKNIHPLLHADLLHVLASMGHGDELVIADANFPAASVGKRLIQLPTPTSTAALEAILTLFPIDSAATLAAITMKVPGDAPDLIGPTRELTAVLSRNVPPVTMGSLERHEFYVRARNAYAVVRTAELRRFANILLVKGVVNRYPYGPA
jgi:L-fucose mutarotase